MPRALFEKTGNAVWISHLDLMRLFQRAFKRAGLPLTHTQGFNPRPSVSIAMPLSVGVESECELLDFTLDGVAVPMDEICRRLNETLVPGVRVLEVYDEGMKIKNLAYLKCEILLEYDEAVPDGAVSAIQALFAGDELVVEKKGKNGIQRQNVIPMIRSLIVCKTDANTVSIQALICCQNPTLNPAQITSAIEKHLPAYRPDFSKCRRIEIFDTNETVFR